VVLGLGALAAVAAVLLDWGVPARAAIVAATCVALWLGELAPVWVPTVLLWVATPLLISTPPNAMAVGTGLLRSRELLVPGLVIMLGGCVLIALTGPFVLRILGVP
jgi:sodium-dependent dicarboxylate transporter 2/3/5